MIPSLFEGHDSLEALCHESSERPLPGWLLLKPCLSRHGSGSNNWLPTN